MAAAVLAVGIVLLPVKRDEDFIKTLVRFDYGLILQGSETATEEMP